MDGEINKLLRRMNMGVRSPAGFSIATLIPIGVRLFSLIQMGRLQDSADDFNRVWLQDAAIRRLARKFKGGACSDYNICPATASIAA